MKLILKCNTCHNSISKELTLFEEIHSGVEYWYKDGFRNPVLGTVGREDIVPDLSTGIDVIPQGYAFKASHSIGYLNPVQPLMTEEQFWLNLKDILPHVGANHHWKKGHGCCGTNILPKKPNRICNCKTSVGYESSDCFQIYVFIPTPETTYWESQ